MLAVKALDGTTYSLEFAWHRDHEDWVNSALGGEFALYDAAKRTHYRGPPVGASSPDASKFLADPATVRLVASLFGPVATPHLQDWLRSFVSFVPLAHETPGFVYIYTLTSEQALIKAGKADRQHVLVHKVGHTTRSVTQRVEEQAAENKEPYASVLTLHSKYPRFFEYHLHQWLKPVRVVKLSRAG